MCSSASVSSDFMALYKCCYYYYYYYPEKPTVLAASKIYRYKAFEITHTHTSLNCPAQHNSPQHTLWGCAMKHHSLSAALVSLTLSRSLVHLHLPLWKVTTTLSVIVHLVSEMNSLRNFPNLLTPYHFHLISSHTSSSSPVSSLSYPSLFLSATLDSKLTFSTLVQFPLPFGLISVFYDHFWT